MLMYALGTGETPTKVGLLPRRPPCKLARSCAVADANATIKKAATHFILSNRSIAVKDTSL